MEDTADCLELWATNLRPPVKVNWPWAQPPVVNQRISHAHVVFPKVLAIVGSCCGTWPKHGWIGHRSVYGVQSNLIGSRPTRSQTMLLKHVDLLLASCELVENQLTLFVYQGMSTGPHVFVKTMIV